MVRVAIDGNIGCGKTFYLTKLQQAGYNVYHEPVAQWANWLKKYNSDMKRYALGFQLKILHDQIGLPNPPGQINVYERSPYTLRHIFGDMLWHDGLFDADEYALHNSYVNDLAWKPDVIIYLFCDPKVCYDRLKERAGRAVEGDTQLTLDYLKKIHIQHECVLDELQCHIPIYKINSQEDPDTVYNNLLQVLQSLVQPNDK